MELVGWIVAILAAGVIIGLVYKIYKLRRQNSELSQQNLQRSNYEAQTRLEITQKLLNYEQQRQNEIDGRINDYYAAQVAKIEQQVADKLRNSHEMEIELARSREEAYKKAEEEFKATLEIQQKQFKQKLSELQEKGETEIAAYQSTINDWRSKADAAMRSYQNLFELENPDSAFRININLTERAELEQLRSVIRELRNPMPFNKAIYEIYFRTKITELANRVVGMNRVSGIYKITHIKSGRAYVGQSVDIKARWIQHAKRGCGAEPMTQNKLYPAMLEFGLENFQFEVLETTEDTSKLSELEKYWQDFYKAIEFGFSMK